MSTVAQLRRTATGLRARARRQADRRRISPLARRVSDRRLTYLSYRKLANIERCVAELNAGGVTGDFVETGVALGGSAILLASQMGAGRRFHGYDVFAEIPPPSERDDEHARERYEVIRSGESAGIGGDPYYGYLDDLYERVVRTFREFHLEVDGDRISLERGLFEDTLDPHEPIALAHIDCDWFDPVMLCLERIHPQLVEGGFLVLDDYNDYGGCRRAVDDFVARHPELAVESVDTNLVLRRTSRAASAATAPA